MSTRYGTTAGRWLAVLGVAALLAAGCGRSGDSGETADQGFDDQPSGETAENGGGDSRIAGGEFGDLGQVCQDGDASGATDTGVTDEEIRVGTVTDKGAEVRSGLTQEMYDVAVAFTEWCNANGGINGRQLVLDDLDAKLSEYGQRVSEACENDFALVGGGAVFDNDDDGQRVSCGLANIAGYAVTPEARVAELQVQPVPNPLREFVVQPYRRIKQLDPEIERFGIIGVNFPGPLTIYQQVKDAVQELDYEIAFDQLAAPMGEDGWRTFVQQMRDQDVQVVEYVGEPEDMVKLQEAMQVEGWYPDYTVMQANMYDRRYLEEGSGSVSDTTYIRTSFAPFEAADDNPGVADYLELMETHNPDGKYPALLGAQGLSSWLLFATAAAECGDQLTRDCLLDNAHATDAWTGGGLHAPSEPGNLEATACGLLMQVTPDAYVYDEEMTNPTEGDGIFNCEEENILDLPDDYGFEAPER